MWARGSGTQLGGLHSGVTSLAVKVRVGLGGGKMIRCSTELI